MSLAESTDVTDRTLRDKFGLLAPHELGALIGVDERTLASWRAARRGPDFAKLGRTVLYRRLDIDAWIEANISLTDRAA